MFQSERFYREAWPTISQAASPSDAAGAIELARRGHVVTGVDFNATEIERAREAASAGATWSSTGPSTARRSRSTLRAS